MATLDDTQGVPKQSLAHSGEDMRGGVASAIFAYAAWGLLPLLFHMLDSVGPVGVVAWRTLWSLLFVGIIMFFGKRLGEVSALFKNKRALRSISISSVLLAGNWLLYVWAIESGHVLEASFGYFINPLVNIAIGMVLLGERQSKWQTISIGIAVVAIAIQAIGIGNVPYVSLGLALSFGFYGYFRKTAKVSSTTGLFAETLVMAPLAIGFLAYSFLTSGAGALADPLTLFLLVMTGPATALPLLAFAYAVRQLRMTTIGMFQYIAPSLQFLLAITFFREELTPVALLSFGLIWISLVVFSVDTYRHRGSKVAV
jgi:chloramphenicol-sensitive protein RarD